MRPPPSSGSPSFATTGCGLTPAVQTTVRVGTTSPVESVDRSLGDRSHRRVREDLDPAPAQLGARERREVGRDLGHHAVARLDEHEAHAASAAARVALDDVRGEVLQLGEPLEARVAGADEHEREQLAAGRRRPPRSRPARASGAAGCAARSPRSSVLKPTRVLGEPRDRQRPRGRAERDDQLVVGQLASRGRRSSARARPCGPGRRPGPRRGAAAVRLQLLAQRHDDVARLERARRGARAAAGCRA